MSPTAHTAAQCPRSLGWFAVLVLVLFWPTHTWAIWEKFSPFGLERPPAKFPQTHLVAGRIPTNTEMADVDIAFRQPMSGVEVLRLSWIGDEGYRLSLTASGPTAPFSMPVEGSPICDSEASTTDLNRDGIPDFILVTHSGGNGLAAQITYITFLLSSPAGYIGHTVFSFDSEPRDLVDLDGDGSPEFVHCMFVGGEVGRDGKSHNYWAYNLLRFSGTDIVSVNRADRRFPKWIMFSHDANHTETRQLTADQRERLWLRAWQPEIRSRSTPSTIPSMFTLAMEQRRNARE